MRRQASHPNEYTGGDGQGHQSRQNDRQVATAAQVNAMMARATKSAAKMTARCIRACVSVPDSPERRRSQSPCVNANTRWHLGQIWGRRGERARN
jgi:hypothetical protein